MSWLKNVSQHRNADHYATRYGLKDAGKPAVEKKEEKKAVDVSELEGAMVGAKVLAEHGAVLKPCAEDMNALAGFAEQMEGWRATQYARSVERYYGALGKQLSAANLTDRPAIAEAAVKSLRTMVEAIGGGELLSPAIAAMTDMISWTSRKEPGKEKTLDQHLAIAKAIRDHVTGLITAMEGRAGVGTALNVYSNLISQVEKLAPNLAPEKRFELWGKVAAFMTEALPRAKVDQVGVANLSVLLGEALPNAGKDPAKALELAKKAAWKELADARKAGKKQLTVVPKEAAAGTPARKAVEALQPALARVIDANPVGPEQLIDRTLQLKKVAGEIALQATEEQLPGFEALAKILDQLAASPVVEPVMQYLCDNLARLMGSADARAALAEAAAGADTAAIPNGIIRAHAAAFGHEAPRLENGLEQLLKLPGTFGMRPALAVLAHLDKGEVAGPMAAALASYARSVGASGLDTLAGFANRFAGVYPRLKNYLNESQAAAVAAQVASTYTEQPIDYYAARNIADICQNVQGTLPDIPIAKLILPDRDKRPGLLDLIKSDVYRHTPTGFLDEFLRPIANSGGDEQQKLELLRWAIHISSELGKFDQDPEYTILPKIVRAFTKALQEPDQIHFGLQAGGGMAIAAQGIGKSGAAAKRGKTAELPALKFAMEHSALAPELVFIAAIHLTGDQNTWLLDQISKSRSRAQNRQLRDMIYSCIQLNHPEVIEALRTSPSSGKAIASTAAFIAGEHKADREDDIPWARIVELLGQGKDPIEEIQNERAKEALAAMNMADLDADKADQRGMDALRKNAREIRELVSYVPEEFKNLFIDMLKQVAAGTWPEARYTGALADRQLSGLDERQKEIWAQSFVTPASKAASAPDTPELVDAMILLKGLLKALPKEVKLGGTDLPKLGWNNKSIELLGEMRDQLLTTLRDAKKGSKEHTDASRKLKPINDNLAVLELNRALKKTFKGDVGSAQETLGALKDFLEIAVRPALRLGGKTCADALQKVALLAPEVDDNPRAGIHGADDDTLNAYLTSYNGGSCLNPLDGHNRRALVEYLTTPQYRMCRVCDGDKGMVRGNLRLFESKLGDEEQLRRCVWIDPPYDAREGGRMDDATLNKLYFRHAITKAMEMGVPALLPTSYGRSGGTHELALEVAKEMGYEPEKKRVEMHIDFGNTGAHQSECVAGAEYWVEMDKGTPFYTASHDLSVIYPKAAAK